MVNTFLKQLSNSCRWALLCLCWLILGFSLPLQWLIKTEQNIVYMISLQHTSFYTTCFINNNSSHFVLAFNKIFYIPFNLQCKHIKLDRPWRVHKLYLTSCNGVNWDLSACVHHGITERPMMIDCRPNKTIIFSLQCN